MKRLAQTWCLGVFGGLMFSLGEAWALSLPVVNPGFEQQSANVYNEFSFGDLPGWEFYDPSGTKGSGAGASFYVGTLTPQIVPALDPVNYQNFPAGAPEGSRVAIAFNFDGTGGTGEYGLSQTLTSTLELDVTYTLTVLVGNIASGRALDGTDFDLSGFPGYRVDLLAGTSILASDDNSLFGTIPEGEWALSTVSYTTTLADSALVGQSLAIRLVNLNQTAGVGAGADLEVDFDQVALQAVPVPESTSGILVAIAALVMAVARSRRFQRLP